MAAGVATTHVGLHRTALVYCAALAVLAALAAGSLIFRRRSRAPGARSTLATSTSTPAVSQNDHVAAAAYLMKHAGATALVVLDGQWPARPVGIVTKAGIAQAAAAGEDLNNIRIRDLMPSAGKVGRATKAVAIGDPSGAR